MPDNPSVTYLGKTTFRNEGKLFGIRQRDRLLHSYIIGQTGAGKSTLMATMALQDIWGGRGCCVIDPHGDLVEDIQSQIPAWRLEDVVRICPADLALGLTYNPLKYVSDERRSLVASGLLDVFRKLWAASWGQRLEHIMRMMIITLLAQNDARFDDMPKLIYDAGYRTKAISVLSSEQVKTFWAEEFPQYTKHDLSPLLNKIGSFLVHPAIQRLMLGDRKRFSFRGAMDQGKVVLINLSKGQLGSDVTHVLGALFATSISSAGMSRADLKPRDRKPFFLYLDEFHNFTTGSLADMMAELRKYGVGLVLAHQFLDQLKPAIRDAVLGNVGTLIAFRSGADDAQYLARQFKPCIEAVDVLNLSNHHIYLRLMIDGSPSKPFSASTIRFRDIQRRM